MNKHISQTKAWISRFVVGENLCPFAAKAISANSILFHSTSSNDELELLQSFWRIINDINNSSNFNSGMLILEDACKEFDEFLNLFDKANWLLEDTGLHQQFQLASFHPNYIFQDKSEDDVSNYTNKSPFPLIHILSIDEVSKAIENHPNIDNIPSRNIKHLEELGIEKIKELLKYNF